MLQQIQTLTEFIRCDYCDKLEMVSENSLNAKIPYWDELDGSVQYDDSCSQCTEEYRKFKLGERARREKAISE